MHITKYSLYRKLKTVFSLNEMEVEALHQLPFRYRFELGVNIQDNKKRIAQVIKRTQALFQCVFKAKDKNWIVLHFFADKIKKGNIPVHFSNLIKCGFQIKKNDAFQFKKEVHGDPEDKCYKYTYAIERPAKFNHIYPIVWAIGGSEINIKPTAFVTAYFVNIERGIIFYIYDDRGLDIIFKRKADAAECINKFSKWRIDI
jgi:hypothetical protein